MDFDCFELTLQYQYNASKHTSSLHLENRCCTMKTKKPSLAPETLHCHQVDITGCNHKRILSLLQVQSFFNDAITVHKRETKEIYQSNNENTPQTIKGILINKENKLGSIVLMLCYHRIQYILNDNTLKLILYSHFSI